MERSPYVEGLFAALADAQGEIENAEKGVENTFFHSRYADLAEVLNQVRPVFSKHGLGILQLPTFENGKVTVETIITYRQSGQFISEKLTAEVGGKKDVQAVGSTITYLRRYALSSMAGIAQEDEDGNGGAGEGDDKPPKKPPKAHNEADLAIIREDLQKDFDRKATSLELVNEWWGDNGKTIKKKIPADSQAYKDLLAHLGAKKKALKESGNGK